MLRHSLIALTVASLLAPTAARACGPMTKVNPAKIEAAKDRGENQHTQFMDWALSKANLGGIETTIRRQIEELHTGCEPQFDPKGWGVTSDAFVRMNADLSTPAPGTRWKQAMDVKLCDEKRTFQVHNIIQADGAVKRTAMVPGRSLTAGTELSDLKLQARATAVALAAAAPKIAATCNTAAIANTKHVFASHQTRFVPACGGSREPQPYSEEWTVLACGQTIVVKLNFTPAGDGRDVTAEALTQ